ncbi:MAG: 2-C-methyl-D-erythritol 2,4-cyclodiphosphate synthase [Calditrichaeota bacterium]|nr:2-C-methyl-D-erythritol 2,4-cyclodiphosphate synthase [Calditrichota bacterium]
MSIRVGLGQDSHRFDRENPEKKLVLGGIVFEGFPGLKGNSDADVVLHAITNAVSGVTGVNILGERSDYLCREKGITDSRVYLKDALRFLKNMQVTHVSISIEAKIPPISPRIDEMKAELSGLLGISPNDIGITATSGEGLTPFGKGEGIQVIAVVTVTSED